MHAHTGVTPALTVALALAVGIIAQSVARHIRLPGIVILLAAGVLLGADGVGVIDPGGLGNALHVLVEFAVAVILFEGGLNLEWRRLRREGGTIRRFVTIGALVTSAGGAMLAHYILGAEWSLSILLGTLVVVTGPTVITPLLRRIRVKRNIETMLEAEGVFIDAVGAILAVVALEVVLSPSGSSLAIGFVSVPTRLLVGAIFGVVGGMVMMGLLRFRGVVPEGLENVFTLSLALAVYQTSNLVMPETGITAVIVAGLVLGNARTPIDRELKEFKEQLTVLFIGMLFVLLAADVRVESVTRLGWGGVGVVAGLMFIVRPVNVWLCTLRSGLGWREKTFLSWLAPRGIVAAAVSSLFYDRLSAEGIEGGAELRALVFLVIAVTVVFQGSTGGIVARALGVRRPRDQGYAILGANELGRTLARLMQEHGEEVVLLDASTHACQEAEREGYRVAFGNALEERVLLNAEVESRRGAIGLVTNEAVSLLFVRKAREEYHVSKTAVAIDRGHGSLEPAMIADAGAEVLFANETDVELWAVRIRRGIVRVEPWRFDDDSKDMEAATTLPKDLQNVLLPLGTIDDGTFTPITDRTKITPGTRAYWLILDERQDDARDWLAGSGWREPASGA